MLYNSIESACLPGLWSITMDMKEIISAAPEAGYYSAEEDGSVRCELCAKKCTIKPDETGFCGVRHNDAGLLRSLVHGRVAAVHVAPSEIKPFFHFYPGALWLSLGTIGCNLKCPGCQNWHLAHTKPDPGLLSTEEFSAQRVAEMAQRSLCAGLSFTYNEPTVWLEFTLEAARAARKRDMPSTYVSNGMMSEEALAALVGTIEAFRFDVKGFSSETYSKVASPGDWEQVKRNAESVAKQGAHLEIVTNVIPGYNDDIGEMAELAAWIKSELGRHVPWHVTRFHPAHGMEHVAPTPLGVLERVLEAGREAGLEFVYIGNVPGHPAESTYCPGCGNVVIKREGLQVKKFELVGDKCKECGREINIVLPPWATEETQVLER